MPLKQTVIDKILHDWKTIGETVDRCAPKQAVDEHRKIREAIEKAIRDLPERFKPIRELVLKVQNESYINKVIRAKYAARGVPIFVN
jgi:hypothetical protein